MTNLDGTRLAWDFTAVVVFGRWMSGIWSGWAWEHFWLGVLGWDGMDTRSVFRCQNCLLLMEREIVLSCLCVCWSVRYLLDGAAMGEGMFRWIVRMKLED